MPTARPDLEALRRRVTEARGRTPVLLEAAEAVRVAMRQTSDAMDDDEGGGDQAELSALFAALKGLLDEVSARITRAATMDQIALRQQGQPIGATGDVQWDRSQCEFSITRAIAAQLGFTGVDAGRERETSAELVRRSGGRTFAGIPVPLAALSVRQRDATPMQLRAAIEQRLISTTQPPGGPGSALIQTLIDPSQWVDVLRPAMAVRQLGARVLSNLTANLNLPALTAAAVAGWFAENSAIPTSDESFADIPLRPKHMGAIVEVSRNMLQQSIDPVGGGGIEAIVRNDLAQVLARGVDTVVIQGAGTAIEPLGIVTDAAVASLPQAAPTYDLLVDLTSLLAEKNALFGSLGWLCDAKVRGELLKLKDLYGRPYGLDMLFQGYPWAFTNLASGVTTDTDPILFGAWDNIVIGMWSELDLLVNPYDSAAYSKGNVLIRGAMTIDVAKRHVESFSWMSTP
jgi:HK97 family phage major capsid protein